MRTAWCLGLVAAACVNGHLGGGVLREDWSQRPRDEEPTADPTAELTGNPWAEHDERVPASVGAPFAPDAPTAARAQLAALVLAALAGGWTPLLTWRGTFDEVAGVGGAPAPPPAAP